MIVRVNFHRIRNLYDAYIASFISINKIYKLINFICLQILTIFIKNNIDFY